MPVMRAVFSSILSLKRLYWREVSSLSGRLPSKKQVINTMMENVDDTVEGPGIDIYINSTFYSFEIKFHLSLLLFKIMFSQKLMRNTITRY